MLYLEPPSAHQRGSRGRFYISKTPHPLSSSIPLSIHTQNFTMMNDQEGLAIAIEEAKISYEEGGVPVSMVCHVVLLHNLSLQ